ncbi:MAG: hypothetical protein Phog2KO_22150 [Phototrophicaceae bacterium]
MYTIRSTRRFEKQYTKLQKKIRDKVDKQIAFLAQNPHHPSLNTKKMQNTHLWECRVDYHFRMVFELQEKQVIILLFVGTHEIYRKVA